MNDALTDVLAERSRLDRGWAGGIAASFAIHGAVTAAAVLAALHHPQKELRPAINIRFAPTPAAIARVPDPARTPTPPVPAVAPATLPAVKPQPSVSTETMPPVATPPQRTTNVAPPSPFGRSPKKPAAVPAGAPPLPATGSPGTSKIEIPLGGSGVTGLEGGDFPYTVYIERMRTIIGTHWFRPQGDMVTTTVHFTIDRDGTLRDVTTETPSGDGTFDRAALRAILESSPLPPLPFAYNGTFLGVHLTFR